MFSPVTAPSPNSSAPAPCGPQRRGASPVELSAKRLHGLALEAFRIGNRGRLSLCDALRILGESRLHLDLGYPSLAAYAGAFFHLRRSETFEHVRVSRALAELTELREAFACGRIGWSVVKAVTRAASVATQSAWLAFARGHDVERTLAEARDARRRGRDAPRESSWGLPNLDQKLVLRFSRSDMDKVRKWLESACAEVAAKTGTDEVALEQAILFLCEEGTAREAELEASAAASRGEAAQVVRTDAPPEPRPTPRAQIVYQRCPDCRRARVATCDGFVEVEPDEVERYAGSAEPLVIDGPTPPALRRRVLGRVGGRCGNPRCHHRADHCHHLVFRSRGGKTELENEVGVCRTCHALIHAGLLRVSRDAGGELRWEALGAASEIVRDVAADRAAAERLPVLQFASMGMSMGRPATGLPATEPCACAEYESADADSTAGGYTLDTLDRDALAQGMARLGVPLGRSRHVIASAIAALPRDALSEATVLRRALALI